jgi:uncharacterized protein
MVAGDMAGMGEMIADDAKWHWPGTSRVSGDFEGKEAILAMFAEPMPEGMTWQSELHAVLADDEHTVALIKNTVVRNGETIQNDVVQVFHIANGKVTEAWITSVDPAALEAVFGAESRRCSSECCGRRRH